MKGSTLCLLGAAALACGCEAKIGNNAGNAGENGQSSAEGKAQEGQIALDAPGFSVKLNVPLDRAKTDNDDKLLYPGSALTGIYIDAHARTGKGDNGEVELRFSSSDPPDTVAAWYRDPARKENFSLSSDGKEGGALVMAGTRKDDNEGFRLRLEPKGQGTDGRLLIRDRD